MTKVIQPNEIYKYLDLEDLPGEIWADIEGWEGHYKISIFSRVKSLDRLIKRGSNSLTIKEKILTPTIGNRGYLIISLGQTSKISLHRLMATTFIPNPENKRTVNHIDGDKLNNQIWNLEWNTDSENIAHSYRIGIHKYTRGENSGMAKLKDEQVRDIKKMLNEGYLQREIAVKHNISRCTIGFIKTKRIWNHIE